MKKVSYGEGLASHIGPNKMWLKSFMKVMLSRNNNSERALVDANRELVEANRALPARMEAKLAEVWGESENSCKEVQRAQTQ